MTEDGRVGAKVVELEGRAVARPVRKDEIVIAERGLYIESWLPERRSRRKPLYLLHGELGGSWVWERYLGYFARRGWEGHALNLRAHFWSETAEFDGLDFHTYLADAVAGMAALRRPVVVVGHGLGALLALKLAEAEPVAGLVLLSPALPEVLLPPARPHLVRTTRSVYRQDVVGWDGPAERLRHLNPDLSLPEIRRIQHLMGAESSTARRQVLEGIPVDPAPLRGVPVLVIGGGIDRQYPAEGSKRLAGWLGAAYELFEDRSHYGLVSGEGSSEPVAEAIRRFLEANRL